LVTQPRADNELIGLVYSLTPVAQEEHVNILHKPVFWAGVAMAMFAILQIIFW